MRYRAFLAFLALVALAVGQLPSAAGAASAPPELTLRSKQESPILYNQGIARVTNGWILSGTLSPIPNTDVLVRTDEQFNVVARRGPAIPDHWRAQGYVHIGDIDVVGNIVYAPFEQPDYTTGSQVTARYDARTLRFIDAVVLAQHENSFVTVNPTTRVAYSMDHFDGDTFAALRPRPPVEATSPASALVDAAPHPGCEHRERLGLDLHLR